MANLNPNKHLQTESFYNKEFKEIREVREFSDFLPKLINLLNFTTFSTAHFVVRVVHLQRSIKKMPAQDSTKAYSPAGIFY